MSQKKRPREDEAEEVNNEEEEEEEGDDRPPTQATQNSNEDGAAEDEKETLSALEEFINSTVFQATSQMLPKTNLQNVLNSYDQKDQNLAISLPLEDSNGQIAMEIIHSLKKKVLQAWGEFFQSVDTSHEIARCDLPIMLLGYYNDMFEGTTKQMIRGHWIVFLTQFFNAFIAGGIAGQGFPPEGLVEQSEQAEWSQLTATEKELCLHMNQLIKFEADNLPLTLLEYMNLFHGYEQMPMDFPIQERKLRLLGEFLKNAVLETRDTSVSQSLKVLTLFRELYRPFVARHLKHLILIGGETLLSRMAILFSKDSKELKYAKTSLLRPYFTRLVHLYRPICSLSTITSSAEDTVPLDSNLIFSSGWCQCFTQKMSFTSYGFYEKIVFSESSDFNDYRSDIPSLFKDLWCALEIYNAMKEQENTEGEETSEEKKVPFSTFLAKIEKAQRDLAEFANHYLIGQWCKNKKVWLDYYKTLTLRYTFSKSEKLLNLKKSQDLFDEKDMIMEEDQASTLQKQHEQQWAQFRSTNDIDIGTLDTLEDMSRQAMEEEIRRSKAEQEGNTQLKDSLVSEVDTNITDIFPTLMVFTNVEDADEYNLLRLGPYFRSKIFSPHISIIQRSDARITSSSSIATEFLTLPSASSSSFSFLDFSQHDGKKTDEKTSSSDQKVGGLQNYDFLKKGLQSLLKSKKNPSFEEKDGKISVDSKDPVTKETEAELEVLNEFLETEDVPFLMSLPLCEGGIYLLTTPYKVNGKTLPAKTRLKFLYMMKLQQKNLSIIEEEEQKVENTTEIAAWLSQRQNKHKKTKKDKLQELQLENDGANFDLSGDDYKESEHYKRRVAAIAELQKELKLNGGNLVEIPMMIAEDGKTAFPLFPLQFEVRVRTRTFWLLQYPLHLGYAISSRSLRPQPLSQYRNLGISIEHLIAQPLLLLAMLENCPQQEIEILPNVPNRKNIDTLFQVDESFMATKICDFMGAFFERRDLSIEQLDSTE